MDCVTGRSWGLEARSWKLEAGSKLFCHGWGGRLFLLFSYGLSGDGDCDGFGDGRYKSAYGLEL